MMPLGLNNDAWVESHHAVPLGLGGCDLSVHSLRRLAVPATKDVGPAWYGIEVV